MMRLSIKQKLALFFLALLACCTAIGWQDIPGEFLQRSRTYVTDYGAIPNDGKDDSAAIIACRLAAIANGTYHVHFPAGEWTIAINNVLHPALTAADTYSSATSFGIQFSGDAQNFSILKLTDTGSAKYFYDSNTRAGWNRCQFDNLWFKGSGTTALTASSNTNGFRWWASTASGGVDKGFIFRNCRFEYLGAPLTWQGTSNTDSCSFYSNWFNGCGPIIFDNDQTLIHTFDNCHFWHSGDCFWMKATAGNGQQLQGGGGQIVVSNGDIIHQSVTYSITGAANNGSGLIRITCPGHPFVTGDGVSVAAVGGVSAANANWTVTVISSSTFDLQGSTFSGTYTSGGNAGHDDPYYSVRIDDGAAFYRVWTFDNCKWELRGQASRLLKWPGTASFLTGSHVAFRDCDVSQMQESYGVDTNGRRNIISMGPHKRAVFERSYFDDQLGIEFTDVVTGSVVGYGHQGIVELIGCGLPYEFLSGTNDAGSATDATRGLTGRITLSNGYGRVRATDCFTRDVTNTERLAVDFDYGGENAVRGEPGVTRKRVYLKASNQGWPGWSGGVEFSPRTVLLPENAKIVACGIDKLAASSAATLIQYRIGNDDRTVTYCATGPVRADGHHSAETNESTDPGLYPIRVGSTLNSRRVRLWMGPVEHGGVTSAGEAWVEYE